MAGNGGEIQWCFSQVKGSIEEEVADADIISCVEFNSTGELLATGDKGGRVVIFQRDKASKNAVPSRGEYNVYSTFQSHEPEFDYLKSLEIEEKINKIRWLRQTNRNHFLLSTNDKTIKLWKVAERDKRPEGYNLKDETGLVRDPNNITSLRVPIFQPMELMVEASPKRVFANAHTYHINSISVNSDQETYLSADDLRINLWNLEITDQSFSSKHKANIATTTPVASIDSFLSKSSNSASSSTSVATSLTSSATSSVSAPKTVQSSFTVCSADVLRAELLWVMKCVDSHYSTTSSNGINQLFKAMFPDSSIAASFGCSERKASYLCSFGLGPYFASQLLRNIQTAENYVLLFDETLNKDLQEKQLDVYVRFWQGKHVVCKFFDSEFMGHATASDLFSKLRPLVTKFGHSKLLQLSMDGPNVNLALAEKMKDDIHANTQFRLLDIGTCGLHTLHNAFRAGCNASGWDLETLLSAAYHLFHDSPARREDFIKVADATQFPLKYCRHRWLENVKPAERLVHLLPNLGKYCSAAKSKEIAQPVCKSFRDVIQVLEQDIVDIKPANMEELTEVITAAEFHPQQCSTFVYSSSKGTIRLCDMRDQALCDKHAKMFEEPEDPTNRSFFSEIISSISDVKFSHNGRYMMTRDYLSVKVWDLAMESRPVETYQVHEYLRSKLCSLYENDCIFDKFECSWSGDDRHIMTGSYNNFFRMFDRDCKRDSTLEACREITKPRTVLKPRKVTAGGKRKKDEISVDCLDFNKKILHTGWHPLENIIAIAATNNLYIFCSKD